MAPLRGLGFFWSYEAVQSATPMCVDGGLQTHMTPQYVVIASS